MKVVCLIKPRAQTIYFVNTIHELFPLSLVIVEVTGSHDTSKGFVGRVIAKIAKDGLMRTIKQHASHVLKQWTRSELQRYREDRIGRDFNHLFGGRWRRIDPSIRVVEVENINDDLVRRLVGTEKPDVLLDHGTSIVRDSILECAPLSLNLHWGLSPYYRGSMCTRFALLHRDPWNIGVTIHRMSRDVDGGEILGQGRPEIADDDLPETIEAKLSKMGTQIMAAALQRVKRGVPLRFYPQDTSQGLCTRVKDWTPQFERELRRHMSSGLGDMLTHPCRNALPIVTLEGDE